MQVDEINELMREFHEKKHCRSIYEAYPGGRREAERMLHKFKQAGIVAKSWRRACGKLKTNDMHKYHKQWREQNKGKVLAYNYKWLSKKFDSQNK